MGRDLFADARIFAQHIVIALDCINECKAMNQIFGEEKLTDLYKTAPVFFKTAYQAMRFRYQIETVTLFDNKGCNFDEFKNSVSKKKLISPQYIEHYRQCRKIAEGELNNLHSRRNKVLAHSDREFFSTPDIFIEENPVDVQKIKALLLSMLKICNAVILHCTENGSAQLHSTAFGDDFVKLIGRKTEADIIADKFLFQMRGDTP